MKKKTVRKAVIPAAGLGTRFLPATKAIPKEMLPIVDIPTVQYIVEEAVASGIEEILIITNSNKHCMENHFDIVYIDAFADFIAGHDIRSEGEMTATLDKLRAFVLQNHVSFRIIHHGTKPTQDSNGSMAGIHTIRDLVDYVFLIKVTGESEVKISDDMLVDSSAKSRYSSPMTKTLKFIADGGSYSFKVIEETEMGSYIGLYSKVMEQIKNKPGITFSEIRDNLRNPKNLAVVLKNAETIDGAITMEKEKSKRGRQTQHYYYVESSDDDEE